VDKILFDAINKSVPKINPLLANGIVTEQLKEVEHYIDTVFKCASLSFPEGLNYVGYKRCTPKEEYAEITRKRWNNTVFELAVTDVYMLKYYFSYNGTQLPPRYLFLPFVRKGGTIYIRGSLFVINPVMTDRLFSVDGDSLFMPLTRDKLTFDRINHNFYANGQRRSVSVVWSHIYHSPKNSRARNIVMGSKRIDAQTTLGHYLFSKYGVTEAFKRFANTEVILGDSEIDAEKYPPEEWIICQSTGIKPATVKDKAYQKTTVRLAIREKDYNFVTESLVAALFYLTDHFSERVLSEYLDQTRLWRTLMGHIIFKSNANEGKLVEDVDAHLISLDDYLDGMVTEQLREEGVYCESIYELFIHIIETMTERIVHTDVSSLYDKRLTVLRYILSDVVNAIFRLTFKLNSNQKKVLTDKDIIKIMEKMLRVDAVMKINTGHGEVSSVSNSGDNMLFKLTSKTVPQTDATGNGKRKGSNTGPSRFLHTSLAEVCSYGNQPKFCPTGHSRINPYLQIGVDGTITQNEEFKPLLDHVQARIARV